MKRRGAFLLATLLAVALTAQPAAAAKPTPASGAVWSANQKVNYSWKSGAEPPAWAKTAINAAAADSNSSRRAKAAVFSYAAGAKSWIGYTSDIPTNWAIGYAVRSGSTSFTIRIRPNGTKLDWGTLKWCESFSGSAPNGCYDLEMVALHEFGHAQTLDHVNESQIDAYTDSLMHASGLRTKAKTGWNQHEYGRCDVARLQIRYSPLKSTTPISTCLDLPTDLSLAPGTGTVANGASVTFTAKLKIGAAGYPNLNSEPLSGRTVVLQRRPVGGSWSAAGNMSATADDSGKYTKTVTVTSTYEWRAVFNSPSNEGLNGSNSGVSRLTVSATGGGSCSDQNDALLRLIC